MFWPNKWTDPCVGISNPAKIANKVVFPEPDGPTNEIDLSFSMTKFIFLSIVKGPSGLLTSLVMLFASKIKFFKIRWGMLAIILISLASSVNSSNDIPGKEKIIVVLGDSLSAGFGVTLEQAWPSLLEKNINAEGNKIKIINAGISGDTTSGGLQRLPKLLSEHKPEIVILELGGNDGLRGMSIKKVIHKNLKEMIKMALDVNAAVLLIGVELPPNYGQRYTKNFENMYENLAEEYNLLLVKGSIKEMVAQGLMQSDGIHPNIEGHQKVEEEVRNKLRILLE